MAGVPPHKVIPGTCFTVDGFRCPQPWVKAYFLSHAHADHYTGLNENWSAGPIYCSPVTASLAEHLAGVPAQYLQPLALDTSHYIEGVEVILVDANHCPGAVQFLFALPDGSKYIHCGDMRYCSHMQDNPHLGRFRGADAVFLDTTYCNPRHTFPPQETAVEFVASRLQQLLQEDEAAAGQVGAANTTAEVRSLLEAQGTSAGPQPSWQQPPQQQQGQQVSGDAAEVQPDPQQQSGQQAGHQQQQQQAGDDAEGELDSQVTAGEQLGFRRIYLISTYVIGKERLLLAVARRTGRRLLVTHRKLQVLKRIGLSDAELASCFTTDPAESPIHVLRWGVLGDTWPYFRPNYTNMEQARQQTGAQEVVGFVPTGWLHEMNKAAAKGTFPSRSKGSCTVWLVPYSEHSSYLELKEYVQWLRPTQVVPTVNVGEPGVAGDKHRSNMLKHFRGLLNEASNKAAFLAKMTRAAAAAGGGSGKLVSGRAASGSEVLHIEGAAAAAVETEATAADKDAAGIDADVGFWDLGADSGRQLDEVLATEVVMAALATQETAAAAAETAAAGLGADADTAGQHHSVQEVTAAGNHKQTAAAAGDEHIAAAADGDDDLCCADSVQLLLSAAGPDSSLTVDEARQVIAAAGGDVNAAMNALLDRQARGQSGSVAAAAAVSGSSSSSSRKRQQKGQPSDRGNKKTNKQTGAAAAVGQAAITAFFGRRGSGKPQQQQQQQQQQQLQQQQQQLQSQQQQGLSSLSVPSASVQQDKDNSSASQQQQQQLVDVKPRLVLPPFKLLKRKSSSPSQPAAAPPPPTNLQATHTKTRSQSPSPQIRPANDTAATAAVRHDQGKDASQVQGPSVEQQSPPPAAAAAAAAVPTTVWLDAAYEHEQSGQIDVKQEAVEPHTGITAQPERVKQAAEAPAGPAEHQQQQQQQQQSAKQSWAALFPNTQQSPAKKRKTAASQQPTTTAAAVRVKPDTDQPTQPPPPSPAPPPPAAAAGGISTKIMSSSSSSSKSISSAMREAPLLPLTRYNPVSDACWSAGSPAPYLALALTLAAVDGTSSRLKISDALTNLFRSLMLLAPQDVTAAAYLLCGKVGPEYSCGCELNVGGGVVSAALSEVTGVSRAQLRAQYSRYGDLGDLAQACRRQQSALVPPPPLTVAGVFRALQGLAAQSGQGAAGRRQSSVALLLRCCRDVETKYLVRTLVQCLRVGAGWKSVLGPMAKAALLNRAMMDAAAAAAERQQQQQCDDHDPAQRDHDLAVAAEESQIKVLDPLAAAQYAASSAAKISKQQLEAAAAAAAAAYHTCPNLGVIVSVLMTYGPDALATRVQLTCGVPVKPMLARPCTGAADAIQLLAATAAAAGESGGSRGRGRRQINTLGGPAAAAAEEEEAIAATGVTIEAVTVDSSDGDESDGDHGVDHDDDADETLAEGDGDDQLPVVEPGNVPVHTPPPPPSAAAAAAPMSSSPSSSPVSSLHILAEYKYDGQRAQIHVAADHKVSIFSRNCEDRTHSFPDVAAALLAAAAPAALPLVIDAELAAVDRADGNRLRAFQELASRPRGSAAAAAAAAASNMTRAASTGNGKQETSTAVKQQRQQTLDRGAAHSADIGQQQQATQQQQQQVQSHESGIDICIFVFDALCVGGRDLMTLSLRERRAAAAAALPGSQPGVVQMAQGVIVAINNRNSTATITPANDTTADGGDADAAADVAAVFTAAAGSSSVSVGEQLLSDYFFQALSAGTEGLMLKLLDGPGSVYQPAKRGLSWIKLKRDYLEGLADSIDLVPIGAWQGQGRKVRWYSPFLLAVYDPATESYQSLCRCISGFTDDFYVAATARLGATQIPGPKPYYQTFERPDVWFEPSEVWEIRGADISISPVHRTAAGALHPDRGLGLRFPRFLRIRDDKRPEEASGPDYVVELYNKQTRRVINK